MAANFFGYPPVPQGNHFSAPGPPPPYEAPNQAPFHFGSGNQSHGFSGGRPGGPGYYQGNQGLPPRGPVPPPPPGTAWNSAPMRSMRGPRGRSRGGRGAARGGWFGGSNVGGDIALVKHPQTLYYCDICRVSCAGSQTYEEHLSGSKHKKKEAAAKAGAAAALPPGSSALHCELCDVTCTGSDAYAAHIRGLKHQRVVKLHQKLGKPIPSHEPTIISNRKEEASNTTLTTAGAVDGVSPAKAVPSENVQVVETRDGEKVSVPKLPTEADLEPVGVEFIEEIKIGDKTQGYKCKLCDCQLNDQNAKDMHLKGRRHRLQYKKNVDPSIEVPRPGGQRREWDHVRDDFGQVFHPGWSMGPCPPFPSGPPGPGFFGPRPYDIDNAPVPFPSINDRFIMGKSTDLMLKEPGRRMLFTVLEHVELALKAVSSGLSAAAAANGSTESTPLDIKNALRVGDVVDNLLTVDEPCASLIIICATKPTKQHLQQVLNLLPTELSKVAGAEDPYIISPDNIAGFEISSKDAFGVRVRVTLTSPLMRPENLQAAGENRRPEEADTKGSAGGDSAASATPADPLDVLDKEKCLEALAQLRHSKWFQARLAGSQLCSATILVLKDLKNRWPAWKVVSPWAMQILVHTARSGMGMRIAPADIFKRVLEMISGGILLPGMECQLADPCEREFTDVFGYLTLEQKDELTVSAQQLLRMVCFRQLNKILGLEKPRSDQPAKRTADTEQGNGTGLDSTEKKPKTEAIEVKTEPMEVEVKQEPVGEC